MIIPVFGTILLSLKNKIYIIFLLILIGLGTLHIIKIRKKKKIRREKKRNEDIKTKEERNNKINS